MELRRSLRLNSAKSAGLPISDLAALATALVLIACALVLFFAAPSGTPLTARFTREHVELYQLYDSSAQRAAHRIGLVVLALLTAALLARGRALKWVQAKPVGRVLANSCRNIAALLIVAAVVAAVLRAAPSEWARDLWTPRVLMASTAITVCFVMWARRFERGLGRLALVAMLSYAAGVAALGLLNQPDLAGLDVATLSSVEQHFSVVVGSGDRLGMGRSWHDGVSAYYGVIMPSILAAVQHVRGMLDFGQHIRLIQMLQVFFIGLVVATFFLWRPRQAHLLVLPLLLIGPWITTAKVLFPNQTAWRAFGLPLAVLALLLCRPQLNRKTAALLGLTAGVLIAFNVETGIALSAGIGTFVFLRADERRGRSLLAFMAGIAAGVLASVAGAAWLSGDWSLVAAGQTSGLPSLIQQFSAGYGGLRLEVDPVPIAIFAHAAYVVFRTAAAARLDRQVAFRPAFEGAVAAIMLVWFAYYANRPTTSNLWTFLYLYAFLLTGMLERITRAGRLKRRPDSRMMLRLAAVTLLFVPLALSANRTFALEARALLRPPNRASVQLSGVALEPGIAEALARKANYLRRTDCSLAYFTAHSYLLPIMSGKDNGLLFMAPFAEAMTPARFDRQLAVLIERSPPCVLFDETDGLLSGPALQQQFFRRVRDGLSPFYQHVATDQGWEIWQRKRVR